MHGDKEWCCEDSLPTKDSIVLTCFFSISVLILDYVFILGYKFISFSSVI